MSDDSSRVQDKGASPPKRKADEIAPAPVPPQRVVRRRRGLFKRSRTGCGTCKRRGKKCDEMWSPEGFCQRCLAGPWECSGRSAVPPRGNKGASSSPTHPIASGLAASPLAALGSLGVAGVASLSGGSSVIRAALPPPVLSPTSGLNGPPSSTRSDSVSSHTLSVGTGSASTRHIPLPPIHSHAATAASLMSASTPVGLTSFAAGLWNGYLNPDGADKSLSGPGSGSGSGPGSGSGSVSVSSATAAAAAVAAVTAAPGTAGAFPAAPFSQPLFDWPSSSTAGMHSTALSTTPEGSLAIDATSVPARAPVPLDSSLTDFWADLATSFHTDTTLGSGGAQTAQSRLLFLAGDRPMRQGVSLAEIYARVVESWLVGLPPQKREYARERILALNEKNSPVRAVRYAVSAAYIFLYAFSPEGHKDQRSKLVDLACRGAGISDSNTSTTDGIAATDTEQPEHVGAVHKIRLYVDHVSKPFASDVESIKWTQDAVRELRQVQISTREELSDLLWGIIDLQLVEFIRGGAAPSYNMLALGDRLVRSVCPGEHPPLSLWDLRTPETFSLRLFAISDISRCIVQRGRRTIFNFYEDPSQTGPSNEDEEPWTSPYLGMPDSITTLLAQVVNLCYDKYTAPAQTVRARADALETALRGWLPPPVAPQNVDSQALVARAIAGEMWRVTAIIVLYQSVHRVGGLHAVLRRCRADLLSLLTGITTLYHGDLFGFLALPAFLAACLSITDADRKLAMAFLVRTGPERVWLDNIALVEKLWEEVDDTGRMVDWHDKMTREGLSIAFF